MVHDKWSLQQSWDSNSRLLGRESCPLPLDHGILPYKKNIYIYLLRFQITFKIHEEVFIQPSCYLITEKLLFDYLHFIVYIELIIKGKNKHKNLNN